MDRNAFINVLPTSLRRATTFRIDVREKTSSVNPEDSFREEEKNILRVIKRGVVIFFKKVGTSGRDQKDTGVGVVP